MLIYALDIETLALRSRALVLDIAVVVADLDVWKRDWAAPIAVKDVLKVRPSFVEQLKLGRAIDPGTIEFHEKQQGADKFAQHLLTSNEYPTSSVQDALNSVRKFMRTSGPVWINGLSFDPMVLRTLAEDIGDEDRPLWNFRDELDVRTVRKLHPALDVKLEGGPAHDAHKDSLWNLAVAHNWYFAQANTESSGDASSEP